MSVEASLGYMRPCCKTENGNNKTIEISIRTLATETRGWTLHRVLIIVLPHFGLVFLRQVLLCSVVGLKFPIFLSAGPVCLFVCVVIVVVSWYTFL